MERVLPSSSPAARTRFSGKKEGDPGRNASPTKFGDMRCRIGLQAHHPAAIMPYHIPRTRVIEPLIHGCNQPRRRPRHQIATLGDPRRGDPITPCFPVDLRMPYAEHPIVLMSTGIAKRDRFSALQKHRPCNSVPLDSHSTLRGPLDIQVVRGQPRLLQATFPASRPACRFRPET